MYKIVLLRHGESIWNKENRFSGWVDVELSEKGIEEAKKAGKLLKEEGYAFDLAFTSLLRRGIRSLWIVLDEMDLMWIPVRRSWRLNERMYGALQGLNKSETAAKHGAEQVLIWRRSYDVPPPAIAIGEDSHPSKDPRYSNLDPSEIPGSECLKDVVARFLPYWHDTITPAIKSGARVLISAHGNSLRALVKYLDDVSEAEILKLNIPTGIPLVYELDDNMKPSNHYYLGDPEEARKAAQAVADQAAIRK